MEETSRHAAFPLHHAYHSVFSELYTHAPFAARRSRTAGACDLGERGSGKENSPTLSTDALGACTRDQTAENSARTSLKFNPESVSAPAGEA